MKIYFASDHAGFEMKNALIEFNKSLSEPGVSYNREKQIELLHPALEDLRRNEMSEFVQYDQNGEGQD